MIFTNKKIELLWDISRHCNLSCNHCAVSANKLAPIPTWDVIYQILSNLKSKRKISLINLQGGEPFSYPFIEKLISFLKNQEMKYSVNTNGLLIDGKMIDVISDYPPQSIIFSFESLDSWQFYSLKNIWSFPKLLENIKKVISIKNEVGISVEGICVITTINLNSIPQIIECANDLGFDILVLSKLCYSGRARVHNYLFPSTLQIYKMFSEVSNYLSNNKCKTRVLFPWTTPCWLEHFGRKEEVDSFYSQCNALVKSNYINEKGVFLPCPKIKIIFDFLKISEIEYNMVCDLKKHSLDEILESSLIEYIYRSFFKNPRLIPPICRACKHIEYCQTCPANYVADNSLVNDTADYKLCEFVQTLH